MKPKVADSEIVITSDALEAISFWKHPIRPAANDAAWEGPRSRFRNAITRFVGWVRSLGPYAAIELILPGGSIIAVALWTYRHRRALRRRAAVSETIAARVLRPGTLTCGRSCTARLNNAAGNP